MNPRLAGLLLLLPVPLVLVLYTRMPLGVLPSLAAGTLLMLTHALYARPFALSRARRRCLWCGGEIGPAGPLPSPEEPSDGPSSPARLELTVREPRGVTIWSACTPHHLQRLRNSLGYASRHRLRLRLGIMGTLLVFLAAAVLLRSSSFRGWRIGDAVAFFQLGVALTVLPLGWLAPHDRRGTMEPVVLPFPAHLQALIGTLAVLWLFRLIGLWWLVQGVAYLLRRIHGG